jgi:lipopolysaccharide biosynthesis protein
MQVARILRQLDYSYLLKFHSKKSTHRDDGQDWLEDMLSKLLPENASVLNDTINALQKPDTGVIGPKGVYYPLTVNFPANGQYMTHVLKRMYRSSIVHKYLQQERAEYGFFGGTMFWARLDSVHDLIDVPLSYFEEEKGQIDGTVAHALERLFCIVSEIEGRKMYEVSESSLQQRPYNSANIPQWSEDHLK